MSLHLVVYREQAYYSESKKRVDEVSLLRSRWPNGLRLLVCWEGEFDSHWGGVEVPSLLTVVCCHVEISATS